MTGHSETVDTYQNLSSNSFQLLTTFAKNSILDV